MDEAEYDNKTIGLLEHVWGDGFLSPGGPAEVDLIVGKAELANKLMLDLGCGTGGITIHLAKQHKLRRIVGFDVEAPAHVIARKQLENTLDIDAEIDFVLGKPGPLPFEDASFDLVFTKDALIHVENLDNTLLEVNRVLKPDGIFLGCDWMARDKGNLSVEMQSYLESEGFEFAPKTMQDYKNAFESGNFGSIEMTNRNQWHKGQVKQEIEHIGNTYYSELVEKFGAQFIDDQLNAWNHLSIVSNSGELFPAHFYCQKRLPKMIVKSE